MSITHNLFINLKNEDKIEFFVHCQRLLAQHHPTSSFLCHAGNIKERVHHIQNFVSNYKGYCYWDDAVCILYNKIIVTDPHAPEHALRAQMYHPPAEHFNAIVVDFVVFRDIKDCMNFVKTNYESKVQYVLFVRHHKVKIYKTVEFLAQILNIQSM